MVRRRVVVLVERLLEDDERVAYVQVGDVVGERLVDAAVEQSLLDGLVDRDDVVVVLWSVERAGRDVRVDAVVPRFGYSSLAGLQRLQEWRKNVKKSALYH